MMAESQVGGLQWGALGGAAYGLCCVWAVSHMGVAA